jgi:hypothetical protein
MTAIVTITPKTIPTIIIRLFTYSK